MRHRGRTRSPAGRRFLSATGGGGPPFTPDLLANVAAWVDSTYYNRQETTGGSATTAAVADGDPVGTVKDRIGGLYPVAPGSTNRPTLRLVNGVAVLEFDGTDDRLSCSFTQAGTAGQFIAVRIKVTAAGSFPMMYVARDAARELRLQSTGGKPTTLTNSGGSGLISSGSSVVGAGWVTVIANHDYGADTAELFVNGVSVATGADTTDPATFAGNAIALGDRSSAGFPFQGQLRHAVYGERALTAGEVAQLNSFLSAGP